MTTPRMHPSRLTSMRNMTVVGSVVLLAVFLLATVSLQSTHPSSYLLLVTGAPAFPPALPISDNYRNSVRAHFWLNILGPSELEGTAAYETASFGQSFQATNYTADGLPMYLGQIMRPHVLDDVTGCGATGLNATNELGESFAGKVVLLRRGDCAYTIKSLAAAAVGAAAVIVQGCSPDPPYNCGTALFAMGGDEYVPIPVINMASADGFLIFNKLTSDNLARVQYNAAQAADPNQTNVTKPDVQPVMLQVLATGKLIPSERALLSAIAAVSTVSQAMNSGYGSNRPWNPTEIDHPTKDPCIDRLAGIWCENGRISELAMTQVSWSTSLPQSAIPPQIGNLTQIRSLYLYGNKFGGPIPETFCQLSNLIQVDLSQQSLTAMPQCTPQTAPNFIGFPNLLTIDVYSNQLTGTFSDLINSTNLDYFDCSDNQISALPASLPQWTNLVSIYANGNQITTLPAFKGMPNIYRIILNSNQIDMTLKGDEFDGCVGIGILNVENNKIKGGLPSFLGCTSLTDLLMSNNQISGPVPTNWAVDMIGLETWHADNNLLTSPMDTLVKLIATIEISLKGNLITANTSVASQNGRVGPFLASVASPSLVTLALDNNLLSGDWEDGWLLQAYALRTVSLSYNKITSLPQGLFRLPITSLDVSNNALVSWESTSEPDATFLTLNLQNNPGLRPSKLPDWISLDDKRLFAYGDEQYLCPWLSSSISQAMKVLVDSQFTSYQGCQCKLGAKTFGLPPDCSAIPFQATVWNDGKITSDAIGATFPQYVENTGSGRLNTGADGDRSLSDSWYGNARITLGISTSWILGQVNATAPLPTNPTTNSTIVATGPVRYLTLLVHISSTNFAKETDVLTIYEGDSSLGTRVAILRGTDYVFNTTDWQQSITNTTEYMQKYGSQITKLAQTGPITVWSLQILTPIAFITFQSRDLSGTRFVATFESHTSCPLNYFYDTNISRCRPNLTIYNVASEMKTAVIIVGVLSCAWCILHLAVILIHWHHSVVRAASRPFLVLLFCFIFVLSLGAILQAAVPSSQNGTSHAICHGRVWLAVMPLIGILSVLWARNSRLSAIFLSKQLSPAKNVSDLDLAGKITIICAGAVLFLLTFSGIPLVKPLQEEGSGKYADSLVQICDNQSGFTPWLICLLVFIFLIMVRASYLAFTTRDIPARYSESTHIMNALFLLTFYGMLIVPLVAFIQDNHDASMLITGMGQALCAILLTTILFTPKIWLIVFTDQATNGTTDKTHNSGGHGSSGNTNSQGAYNKTTPTNSHGSSGLKKQGSKSAVLSHQSTHSNLHHGTKHNHKASSGGPTVESPRHGAAPHYPIARSPLTSPTSGPARTTPAPALPPKMRAGDAVPERTPPAGKPSPSLQAVDQNSVELIDLQLPPARNQPSGEQEQPQSHSRVVSMSEEVAVTAPESPQQQQLASPSMAASTLVSAESPHHLSGMSMSEIGVPPPMQQQHQQEI